MLKPGERVAPPLKEKRATIPGGKSAQNSRVKTMFLHQNAGGQAVRTVAGQNWHLRLAQRRACVKLGDDFVNRAPCHAIACVQRALMRVQTGIFRQKGGVDVDHTA